MTLSRYVLSVAALTVCHIATAQGPMVPGSTGATQTKTQTSASTGSVTEADSVDKPAQTRSNEEAAGTKATEPRYIRGNDRVIAPAKPVQRVEGAPLSFSFEEAPVAEVVRTILGDILKADYVLHPPLSGTVTLATRTPIPPDQAVFLLESALQANGLALLRDARGTYHVGRPDTLKGIGGAIRQVGSGPLPPGYGAIVVPLQYIGAGEMASILRPMASADAIVRVDNVRNLLVLAGTRTQAEGWLDIINTFDVDLLKGMSVGVFPLKHASIQEVETALRLVSGGTAAPGGAGIVGGAAAGTQGAAGAAPGTAGSAQAMLGEGNPLFGALRIMPIERLNSILVVTPRASYLEEARRWIEKLDQPSDGGAEPQLYIYQVQNGNAKHLASVLNGIFGGGGAPVVANSGVAPGLNNAMGNSLGQAGGGAMFGNTGGLGRSNAYGTTGAFGSGQVGGFGSGLTGSTGLSSANNAFGARNVIGGTQIQGGGVAGGLGSIRVMADELNNSVLVWSTKAEYTKIESTLKRLDLPPTQVLIDASIVEVSLKDDLEYGLQWAFNGGVGGGYSGRGVISGLKDGALGGVGQGFSYTLRNAAGLKAVLNALATKSLVKMISNPSLMVLDNHTATIAVGDQTPVRTSETRYVESSTGATTSTIQYKDTGVSLMVTPSVNAGNIVSLQIDQTVTDVGAQDEVSGQRAFMQRQISSKVAVRSGEAIVLGGLIKDSSTTGKTGVPLLQDIPIVGNLFGTNSKIGNRTELIVVITPRVVRTDIDIREVSEDLRDRLKGLRAVDMRDQLQKQSNGEAASAVVQPLPPN